MTAGRLILVSRQGSGGCGLFLLQGRQEEVEGRESWLVRSSHAERLDEGCNWEWLNSPTVHNAALMITLQACFC